MKAQSTSRKVSNALWIFAVLSLSAWAVQTIVVNGRGYRCQNYCVVTTYPAGGWMVTDSDGGWIQTYNPNQPEMGG